MLATIPVKLVAEGTRLRQADDKQVESLVASIRDVGILNPITVYPRKVMCDNIAVDGYGLVCGLHRLTVARILGLHEIPANVVTLGELERQIAECDENLCGPKLSPSEKAIFTRRRKEAYEALHPETRHGGDRRSEQVDNLSTCSYAEDQAAKTGVDARTVRRDAERGEKIDEEVMEMLGGTHLDSGAYMDSIKNLSKPEQRAKVQRDLDVERKKQEAHDRHDRARRNATEGAAWISDAIGSNNLAALIAILESTPTKALCTELRRLI